MKTLFHHTGALISNKFTRHRKKKALQQPLRQISNYVSFTSVAELAADPNASTSAQSKSGSNSRGSRLSHAVNSTPPPRIQVSHPSESPDENPPEKAPKFSPSRQLQSSPRISPLADTTPSTPSSHNGPSSSSNSISGVSSTTNGNNSGLRSRATSFVKGIVGNGSNSGNNASGPTPTKSTHQLTPSKSHTSQSSHDQSSPLQNRRRSTAHTASPGLDDAVSKKEAQGEHAIAIDGEDQNGGHESDSLERVWSNNSDDIMNSSDEDQEDDEEEGEELNSKGGKIRLDAKETKSKPAKKKKKGFFKKLMNS